MTVNWNARAKLVIEACKAKQSKTFKEKQFISRDDLINACDEVGVSFSMVDKVIAFLKAKQIISTFHGTGFGAGYYFEEKKYLDYIGVKK